MKKETKPAVLLLAGLLLLSGCTLAQPERQSVSQDRFIGFQLVYEENRTIDMSDPDWQEQEASIEPEDRSHWVEYGTQNVQTDRFGTLSLPREILIGEYDEEHNRFYFPGKEGYNCFLAKRPSSCLLYTSHLGHFTRPGTASFQWELRRLSRLALDVFLLGTAMVTPP